MAESNVFLVSLVAILGLCVGSFINVVIYRLPKQLQSRWENESRDFLGIEPFHEKETPLTVAFPPSHCPKCNTPIRPWHNIPVISYLFLRGKCNFCAEPISVQYPLIEASSAIIFVVIYTALGITTQGGFALMFSLALLILTGIDFQTQLLPDNLTLPLLWLGLIANSMSFFTSLESAVFGAIFGYLSLWSVYWAFKLLTGKEGMGYGDFKLLAALGAWVGWQQLPLIILLSSLLGAIVGIALVFLHRRDRHVPMAFGPYLAIAGWVALFWGDMVLKDYLAIFA